MTTQKDKKVAPISSQLFSTHGRSMGDALARDVYVWHSIAQTIYCGLWLAVGVWVWMLHLHLLAKMVMFIILLVVGLARFLLMNDEFYRQRQYIKKANLLNKLLASNYCLDDIWVRVATKDHIQGKYIRLEEYLSNTYPVGDTIEVYTSDLTGGDANLPSQTEYSLKATVTPPRCHH